MNSGDITEGKLQPSDLDDGWARFDQMSAADKHAAALSDADAQPINADNVRLMRRTPQVRIIRRALGLTLDEFAARFHIPVDMLKDWELGVTQPDAAVRAYLSVISRNPSAVAEALQTIK